MTRRSATAARRYNVDAVVDQGRNEFGGYDSIVLWPAYPRLGLDERTSSISTATCRVGSTACVTRSPPSSTAAACGSSWSYYPWETGAAKRAARRTARRRRHGDRIRAAI